MLNISSTIRNFKNFLGRKVLGLFVLAVVLGVLWFGVESSFVFVLQGFLAQLGLLDLKNAFGAQFLPTTLAGATWMLIGFGVLRSVIWMLRYYFSGVTSQLFIREQKEDILRFGLTSGHLGAAGEIVTVFSDHANTAGAALQQLVMMINTFVSLVLFVILGLYLAPVEFMVAGVLLVLLVAPTRLIDRKVNEFSKGIADERSSVNRTLLNGLKNNFFLQIHDLVPVELEKGVRSLRNFEKHYHGYYRLAALRNALPLMGGVAVIALTTAFSLRYVGTPGAKLLAFFYLFIRIAQGASDFFTVYGDLKIQSAGLEQLRQWTERARQITVASLSAGGDRERFERLGICARDLSFGYEGRPIFSGVNFDLKAGERLVVKGESGSGKSTLLSVLVGLQAPTSGTVRMNDIDPRAQFRRLSRSVGYVGPEPFLADGSVRENLLFGHPQAESVTDRDLWDIIQRTGLDSEVRRLDNGLDSPVPTDQRFSTGQKQRLSLARALLRKPSLLILDEATSNLDAETERRIVDFLSQLSDVTMLIVTHRSAFDGVATRTLQLGRESA